MGDLYADEYSDWLNATRDCVCDGKGIAATPGPCAVECEQDYCQDPAGARSSECEACRLASVSQGGTCFGAVATNCRDSAGCTSFTKKNGACPRP